MRPPPAAPQVAPPSADSRTTAGPSLPPTLTSGVTTTALGVPSPFRYQGGCAEMGPWLRHRARTRNSARATPGHDGRLGPAPGRAAQPLAWLARPGADRRPVRGRRRERSGGRAPDRLRVPA